MKHNPPVVHNCSHKRLYSPKYDAYYCAACDLWFEARCGDPECEFCRERPDKPSLDKNTQKGSNP